MNSTVILFAVSLASMNVQALASTAPTAARPIPLAPNLGACVLGRGSVLIRRKTELPKEAVRELDRLFVQARGLAEAGEYFENTDAPLTNAPSARFIRAYHVDDVWFIWFERSGRFTLALSPHHDEATGARVFRLVPGSQFVDNLCAGTKAFLSGARSNQ
ncbi:MAG: hypothetical protein K2W81_09995 [Sphingomonas sp.]|uniref:hypothetical protein n=1 Tax=Sphingomonas sp. TaxID=28214 RepID=UPI0025E84A5E|nr:hypothetical protein [Sphingomonas sp.]MBY0284281.1 hypothetical protein [Sphingomonas sp.]